MEYKKLIQSRRAPIFLTELELNSKTILLSLSQRKATDLVYEMIDYNNNVDDTYLLGHLWILECGLETRMGHLGPARRWSSNPWVHTLLLTRTCFNGEDAQGDVWGENRRTPLLVGNVRLMSSLAEFKSSGGSGWPVKKWIGVGGESWRRLV